MWETHGFLNDYLYRDDSNYQVDDRLTEDFIIYIYDVACCKELNYSIDLMLTRGGFFMDELEQFWTEKLPQSV